MIKNESLPNTPPDNYKSLWGAKNSIQGALTLVPQNFRLKMVYFNSCCPYIYCDTRKISVSIQQARAQWKKNIRQPQKLRFCRQLLHVQ